MAIAPILEQQQQTVMTQAIQASELTLHDVKEKFSTVENDYD